MCPYTSSLQHPQSIFSRYYRTTFSIICLVLIFTCSIHSGYMLFHTLVELFSIVVAFAVFIVAWNTRDMQDNKYLHLVGISYLFIGALDLLHTLSFKGMNIIPLPGYPANQFWVATRLMEAATFLAGFLIIGRKRKLNTELVFLFYFVVSLLIAASILLWKVFPACFIEGTGQTPFKIYLEYFIILLLLTSLFLLFRKRQSFDKKAYQLLAGSIIFAILSECCFATYTSNIGPLNEWGHYGKLISFFLIYKANVEMAFVKPLRSIFRELKASEMEYKNLAEHMPDIIVRYDKALNRIYSNQHRNDAPSSDLLTADLSARITNDLHRVLKESRPVMGELEITTQQGITYYAYQIIPEAADISSAGRLLVIFRDITTAKQERLFLTRLLDTIPQQVWTARADGKLDYVNGTVIRDFSADPSFALVKGWQQYVHPDDLQESVKAWQNSIRSGKEYQVQFRLKMADGTYLWHLGRAVPIMENGKINLWIGTNTNIDLQKRGQEERDEFISIASHELKTPLTSIKALNQMFFRTTDVQKLKSYQQKIDVATVKLERLINDMLDVSRINAGKLQFNKSSFMLYDLLLECCETLQLSVGTHRIILEKGQDVQVYADRFRLEQVITNLLSNAVKYSPQADEVWVKMSVEQQGVVVSVKDAGIGIDNRELEKLFDRYYRSDNTAQRFGGLGLGLFISSEIIKAHGGTFWMESVLGEGSVVSFRIPLTDQKQVPVVSVNGLNYQNEHMSIFCNHKAGRVEVNWVGYQNVESVQQGGLKMIEVLKSSGLRKVLNDNREVLGNWSEASDWAGTVWFPLMVKAGLEHFAWVFSPSIFAQFAAQKSFDLSDGKANVRFFHDIDQATEWLDSSE